MLLLKSDYPKVRKNIQVIRHYLEMDNRNFSESAGIEYKRFIDLCTRYRPTPYELLIISQMAGVTVEDIITKTLVLKLEKK